MVNTCCRGVAYAPVPSRKSTLTAGAVRLKGCEMELKTLLAGWSNICPGCNIARNFPESFIGKKVRDHWKKGCLSHNAYVEVYGSDEPSPNKSKKASASKCNRD
jgi:hypothetical protein